MPNIPIPEQLRHRSFSTTEATSSQLGRGRLRGSDLAAPFRGVRVAGETPTTQVELCRVYLARARSIDFFCDVSAALIWRIPLPARLESRRAIDVGVLVPGNPPQARGVRGHRLAAGYRVVDRSGMPVLDPAATWFRLARVLSCEELVIAGDYVVSRHGLNVPPEALAAVVLGRRGAHGRANALAALGLIRQHVRSPKESEARLLLLAHGIREPQINFSIFDSDGNFVMESDLVLEEERVLLEYEGDAHRTSRMQWRKDIRRREWAEDIGWRTIRFTDDDLHQFAGAFIARVREQLRLRSTPREFRPEFPESEAETPESS